jgi:hypothetical protein
MLLGQPGFQDSQCQSCAILVRSCACLVLPWETGTVTLYNGHICSSNDIATAESAIVEHFMSIMCFSRGVHTVTSRVYTRHSMHSLATSRYQKQKAYVRSTCPTQ